MNSRVNITFVINNLGGGGAERVLLNILNNLDRSKFKPKLFLFEYEGEYLNDLLPDVEIGYCSEKKITNNKILKAIRLPLKYLKRCTVGVKKLNEFSKGDDIVVAFLEKMVTYNVSRSLKGEKKIAYAWLHNNAKEFSKIHRILSAKYYKNYDRIFCVSNECTELAKSQFESIANKIHTIYNPIEIQNIIEKSNEEVEFKLPKGRNIVATGRLTYQKGFDILIEAFNKIKCKNVNLIILGEGEDRFKLEQLIEKYKLKERVYIPGFVENPFAILKGADLFILSSRYEGLPTVLIEALALNKNIISTTCSGSTEILENGKYGYLVDINDIDALGKKIEYALENEIKNNGICKAKEFDIKNIMNQLEIQLLKGLSGN